MIAVRLTLLLLLVLAACDRSLPACQTRLDCAAGEHCLVLSGADARCIETPGRDDPRPPLRITGWPAAADVVFIVDDTPAVAPAQARLLDSLPALVEAAGERMTRLRVSATTTSVQSPICRVGSAAHDGELAATSCLDRLAEFVADGVDARQLCTDRCTRSTAELGLSADTPWIDLEALPDGIDPAEALACLVAQGISGCALAAPVGASRRALHSLHAHDAAAPGFRRRVHLVVLTDDPDCSVTGAGAVAFEPALEGTSVAACWAAGVHCVGAPPVYDGCVPIDRAPDGSAAGEDEPTILEPVPLWHDPDTVRHVIAGMPVSGPPSFSVFGDPVFVAQHGIAPGCIDDALAATPPVRLAAPLGARLWSICAPDYDEALRAAAWGADPELCMPPGTDDDAVVARETADGAVVPSVPCDRDARGLRRPPGASACHAWIDGGSGYPAPGRRCLHVRTDAADGTGHFLVTPDPWASWP